MSKVEHVTPPEMENHQKLNRKQGTPFLVIASVIEIGDQFSQVMNKLRSFFLYRSENSHFSRFRGSVVLRCAVQSISLTPHIPPNYR